MKSKRGGTILKLALSILVLLAVLHSAFHLSVFGTGVSGLAEKGLSGFSIGEKDVGEELNANPKASPLSLVIIILEWTALVLVILFAAFRKRIYSKQEGIKLPKKKKDKTETDIDLLYEALKEYKKLKISTIARLFKINKKTALEWASILESGNLAILDYPIFGQASLTLKENGKEKEKRNEKKEK